MTQATKILLWSPDEAEARIEGALKIMERLDVDELHWPTVFTSLMQLLGAAGLQQEQAVPLNLGQLSSKFR